MDETADDLRSGALTAGIVPQGEHVLGRRVAGDLAPGGHDVAVAGLPVTLGDRFGDRLGGPVAKDLDRVDVPGQHLIGPHRLACLGHGDHVVEVDEVVKKFIQSSETLTVSTFAPQIEYSINEIDRVEASRVLLGRFGSESPEVARFGLFYQEDVEEGILLSLLTQDPLLTVPAHIVAGDIDGNQIAQMRRDIIGVFTNDDSPGYSMQREFFAHVILGSDYQDKRLSGVMLLGSLPTIQVPNNPLMWLIDCDQNGIDDLVVFKIENIHYGQYGYQIYEYFEIAWEFHLMGIGG